MPYRKRSKKRTPDGDGVMRGSTHLSTGEADGTAMRRRYAFYAAACLVFLATMIALLSRSKSAGANAVNGGGMLSSHFKVESQSHEAFGDASFQLLRHEQTGMAIMTMVPADTTQDATFGLNFRTVPDNNHGTAHVVEHALFDGSKNYPVRDIWNQLAAGTLQTYTDSWTSKDRTVFVMSSRNKADFKNNIQVMMDAVTNPLMVEEDSRWMFRQEGWRLEEGKNKEIILNGNAVNEARAAQMHPHQSMMNTIYEHLFPSNAYRFNSRGETDQIVKLTHEEMIEFYRNWYHPSNGQAFCYGAEEFVSVCLEQIHAAISDMEKDEEIREKSAMKMQPMNTILTSKARQPYASSSDDTDYRLALSWVLNDDVMDGKTEAGWYMLEELFFGSSTAIFPKMISDLQLGDDVMGGLEYTLQQWTMIIGVTGIKSEDAVQKTEKAITDKLKTLTEQGFDPDAVLAAANKLDYRFREESSGDMPMGAALWTRVVNKWNYDRDPRLALNDVLHFESLKTELATKGPGYLIKLITKKLLDNQDHLTLEMYPSTDLGDMYATQEQAFIDKQQEDLSKEEGQAILRESAELRKFQKSFDSEEALASIPRVKPSDISKQGYEYPVKIDKDVWDSGLTILEHELPDTNGMVYVDFAMDISKVDFDDIVLLPLYCKMITSAGTDRVDPTKLQQAIDTETGGISVWPVTEEIVSADSDNGILVPDGTRLTTKIVIRASTLASTESVGLFSVIRQCMFEANVHNSQVAISILKDMIDDMEDDIQGHGYKFTSLRIESRYSLAGFAREQWQGVTQLLNLRRALNQAETDWDSLALRLANMQQMIITGHRNGMLMSVTGDKSALKSVSPAVEIFVKDFLPDPSGVSPFPDFTKVQHTWVSKGTHRFEEYNKVNRMSEAFIVPSRVNQVAKGGLLYDVGERIHGSDIVVTEFLEGFFLYDRVRFGLGAKDAWATLDKDSGVMLYQSERDPNVVETLDVYEEGATALWDLIHDKASLPVEAQGSIVGAIGTIDGTAAQPNNIGYSAMLQHLKNESPEMRQKWRDEVLGTNKDSFMAFIERLGSWGRPSIAIVASQKAYDKAVGEGLNMTSCDYTGYVC